MGKIEWVDHLGDWYYSPEHGEFCRVIETQTLWGNTGLRDEC